MKKSFIQRLREVRAVDIFHIVLFLIALIPAFIYKHTHGPFWLICEYAYEARDNGYYFFRYMRQMHPEQRVIYAIDRSSVDYERVKNLGETVHYGSLGHWVLYLAAEVNISSQKGGKPNAAVCYVLEVYGILRNKRVFLQHGITKDNLPYVHYANAKFVLFSVSVEQEYQYVTDVFGYPNGVVQKLGLCRFDDLQNASCGETVLVMPTWRAWVANGNRESFQQTEYYQKWISFLQSNKLHTILAEQGKTLIFYPHRNMQKFMDVFCNLETERIRIAAWPEYDVHELLKRSALLITDYSSVAMDFAYMNKPVIYYQFDQNMFRTHQMEEGFFIYERDGFGPVVYKEDTLLETLEHVLSQGIALDKEYKKRIDCFFDLRDSHNCERTYHAILKIR